MPKYKLVNCREERCKNRNQVKEITELRKTIFKKNDTIIEIRKKKEFVSNLFTGLEEAYNFTFNAYQDLYSSYNKLKESFEKIKIDYNQLLEEYIEELIDEEEN